MQALVVLEAPAEHTGAQHQDDKDSLIRALESALPGCEMMVARDRAAVEAALQHPDLGVVVTGYRLSWVDALALLAQVRAERPGVPVVMVTQYGDEALAVRGLKAGLADYVPWTHRAELGERVRQVLDGPQWMRSGPEQGNCVKFFLSELQTITEADSASHGVERIFGAALTLTGATAGYVGLLTEDQMHLNLICATAGGAEEVGCGLATPQDRLVAEATPAPSAGLSHTQGLMIPLNAFAKVAVLRGQVIISNISAGSAIAQELLPHLPPPDSMLVAPMTLNGEVRGLLVLANKHMGFTQEDVSTGQILAQIAAAALHQRQVGEGVLDCETENRRQRERSEPLAAMLQRERDLLQIIMENTDLHLAYLDTDFNYIRVNGAYAESARRDPEAMIGQNHFEYYPDPENQMLFETVVRTGKPLVFKGAAFRFPDQLERGTTYWNWSLVPTLEPGGEVDGLVLSLVDVTMQERTSRRLERDMSSIRQLVNVAEQVLAEHSVDGLMKRVIEAARALTGARSGHVIHQLHTNRSTVQDDTFLVVTSDADGIIVRRRQAPVRWLPAVRVEGDLEASQLYLTNEEMRQYLAVCGVPCEPEKPRQLLGVRLISHYGETRSVMILSSKELNPESDGSVGEAGFTSTDEALVGQLVALASLAFQHIEAHIEADQRVAELDATIAAIADGIVIYAPDGKVVRMNEAASRILHRVAVDSDDGELVQETEGGVDCADRPAEELRALVEWRDQVTRALRGERVSGFITWLSNRSTSPEAVEDIGSPIWLSVSVASIYGSDQTLIGAVSAFTDITESRAIQNSLEEANERLALQAEQLQARNRDLRLLNAVGRELSGTLELSEVLDRVIAAIGQILPASCIAIWLVDRDDPDWLKPASMWSEPGSSGAPIPKPIRVGEGMVEQVKQSVLARSSFEAGELKNRQMALAERSDASFVMPLHSRGQVIGVIGLVRKGSAPREFFSGAEVPTEPELHRARAESDFHPNALNTLAAWTTIAIENALLHRNAQEAAVVAERSRLASELHDAVSQLLFSAKVTAESLLRLWETQPETVHQGLSQLKDLTEGALAEMRTLLLELRPSALVDADLRELLGQLTQAMAGRGRMSISLHVEELAAAVRGAALPDDVQITYYRVAQEALNNIVKHARATHTDVWLRYLKDGLELIVQDNGRGFIPVLDGEQGLSSDQAFEGAFTGARVGRGMGGLGLKILRERAVQIGAKLEILSRPGGGTRVALLWHSGAIKGESDDQS